MGKPSSLVSLRRCSAAPANLSTLFPQLFELPPEWLQNSRGFAAQPAGGIRQRPHGNWAREHAPTRTLQQHSEGSAPRAGSRGSTPGERSRPLPLPASVARRASPRQEWKPRPTQVVPTSTRPQRRRRQFGCCRCC